MSPHRCRLLSKINIPAMSGEQKREVLLFFLTLCISTFQPGRSVSLGKLEDPTGVDKVEESTAPRWIQLDPHQDKWLPDRKVTSEQQQHKTDWPGSKSPPLQIFPIEEEAILRKLGKTSSDFTVKDLPWTAGNVSKHQGSQRAADSEKEYQSDFTGGNWVIHRHSEELCFNLHVLFCVLEVCLLFRGTSWAFPLTPLICLTGWL